VAYCDSTVAFPLFCEYVVGSERGRRECKQLLHRRDELVMKLKEEAMQARRAHPQPHDPIETMPDLERHR